MGHSGTLVYIHHAHLSFLGIIGRIRRSGRRKHLILLRYFRDNLWLFLNWRILIKVVAIWLFIEFAETIIITDGRKSWKTIVNHRSLLILSFTILETNFNVLYCGFHLFQQNFIWNVTHKISKHHIKYRF